MWSQREGQGSPFQSESASKEEGRWGARERQDCAGKSRGLESEELGPVPTPPPTCHVTLICKGRRKNNTNSYLQALRVEYMCSHQYWKEVVAESEWSTGYHLMVVGRLFRSRKGVILGLKESVLRGGISKL